MASKLREHGLKVAQLHFADALKKGMADLFGFEVRLAYSQEGKNSVHGPSGLKIREILQEGASRLRELWPAIWVYKWDQIRRSNGTFIDADVIIAADVRYKEEMQALKLLNAPLVYIDRRAAWDKRADDLSSGDQKRISKWMHESEQHFAIHPELADYVLQNQKDTWELSSNIDRLLPKLIER